MTALWAAQCVASSVQWILSQNTWGPLSLAASKYAGLE